MVEGFTKNEEAIKRKVRWTKCSLIFLEFEALALVIFLLFYILVL